MKLLQKGVGPMIILKKNPLSAALTGKGSEHMSQPLTAGHPRQIKYWRSS